MARRRGKGEGSIEELPSGKYRAILSLGGKKKIRSPAFPKRKQAVDWLHQRIEERWRGLLREPCSTLLSEWLDQWLDGMRERIEPYTLRGYQGQIEWYLKPELGHMALGALKMEDVERAMSRWANDGQSACVRRAALQVLRMALKKAMRRGLITHNVAAEVDKPRHKTKEWACWTVEQARQFLDATRLNWLHPLYVLALDSGMRLGEVLALTWQDVDLVEGCVDVRRSLEELDGKHRVKQPKTQRGRRRIWIGAGTVACLQQHREQLHQRGQFQQTGPVFPSRNTGWWIYRTVLGRNFRKAVRRAGVPAIRPYDMRHTSATLLLQAGASLKMVSERLGHENVATTLNFYVRVLPGEQQKAAQMVETLFPTNGPH